MTHIPTRTVFASDKVIAAVNGNAITRSSDVSETATITIRCQISERGSIGVVIASRVASVGAITAIG